MTIEITTNFFYKTSSQEEQYPEETVFVDSGYTLVGGGTVDNWKLNPAWGNMLTDSCPVQDSAGKYTGWKGRGKDCWHESKSKITVYAIGIKVTKDGSPVNLQQKVWAGTSAVGNLAEATVDSGWTPTCGGASVSPNNSSLLLQASSPEPSADLMPVEFSTWKAGAQYCQKSVAGEVTSYIIGIQAAGIVFTSEAYFTRSPKVAHPSTSLGAPGKNIGGGAWVGYGEENCFNFLTSSSPICGWINNGQPVVGGWEAAGKDHITSSPAALTVCAINLKATAA